MSITPYDYQIECLDNIEEARRKGKKSALVVMASGLGKTVTAALDAKKWLQRHGGRLLYLCHQNDILEQARATFESLLGGEYTYGVFHGGEKTRSPVSFLFASFQTMRERRDGFQKEDFSYIVVDESHHGPAPTFQATLDYFQPEFLLGVTATPDRTDLQDIRGIYGKEVFSLELEDALARGLLTPVSYRLITDELQNLKVLETPTGRLSIKQLNKNLFVPRRDEEIVNIIQRHASKIPNCRIMIFCPSVAYCDRLATHMPGSFAIHNRLSFFEQRKRLNAFRKGLVDTVLVVDKFNEGIDIPEANVIVFLRSTISRTLFYQQLGRGLRKVPGKYRTLVLDFVGNCERLELVHHLWTAVKKVQTTKTLRRRKPLSVDIGKVRFTVIAKRVLNVLNKIRHGYTKEVLIKQLRALTYELGRFPLRDDVIKACKAGKCASYSTFKKYFGSLHIAFIATRFGRVYTKKLLIKQLQVLAAQLGKTPGDRDIKLASKTRMCAHPKTFVKIFGSFNAAIEAARLLPHPVDRLGGRYGREQLIRQLKSLAGELGKTPIDSDIGKGSKAGKCASPSTFRRVFGSLAIARELAGLPRPLTRRRE